MGGGGEKREEFEAMSVNQNLQLSLFTLLSLTMAHIPALHFLTFSLAALC